MDYEDDILVATENDEEIETEIEPEEESVASTTKQYKNFPKYSNEKLERVYNKYDFSKTYNPNSHKKDGKDLENFVKQNENTNFDEESFTVEKSTIAEQEKSSKKFSIFKICGTIVCALLVILSMINLATITDLEKKVETSQKNVNEVEVNVGKFIQDVGKLTNEEDLLNKAEQEGMEEITEEFKITLNDKNQIIEYESKTNFFDKICEVLFSLFGG